MLLVVQFGLDSLIQQWKETAKKHASDVKKNEEVVRKLKKKKEQYEGEWCVSYATVLKYNTYCGLTTNNTSSVYITISTGVQWVCPLVRPWNVVN